MVTVESESVPSWLSRAAEIADATEAELELCKLLKLKISGWPQTLALGADGQPIRDREFDALKPELERSSMRLRAANTPAEIHIALRSLPPQVMRGLRMCAEAGVIPACLLPPTKE